MAAASADTIPDPAAWQGRVRILLGELVRARLGGRPFVVELEIRDQIDAELDAAVDAGEAAGWPGELERGGA